MYKYCHVLSQIAVSHWLCTLKSIQSFAKSEKFQCNTKEGISWFKFQRLIIWARYLIPALYLIWATKVKYYCRLKPKHHITLFDQFSELWAFLYSIRQMEISLEFKRISKISKTLQKWRSKCGSIAVIQPGLFSLGSNNNIENYEWLSKDLDTIYVTKVPLHFDGPLSICKWINRNFLDLIFLTLTCIVLKLPHRREFLIEANLYFSHIKRRGRTGKCYESSHWFRVLRCWNMTIILFQSSYK